MNAEDLNKLEKLYSEMGSKRDDGRHTERLARKVPILIAEIRRRDVMIKNHEDATTILFERIRLLDHEVEQLKAKLGRAYEKDNQKEKDHKEVND